MINTEEADKKQYCKEILAGLIKSKLPLYGKVLVSKIAVLDHIDIAPGGEIISIKGDCKQAIEHVIGVFKEIAGSTGLASAVSILKEYSERYPGARTDLDEVIERLKLI